MLKVAGILRYFPFIVLLVVTASSCSSIHGTSNSKEHSDQLSGVWDVDFDMSNTTFHSQMTLKQDGSQFFGDGMDANSTSFSIVNGQVNGNQLDFFKKYSDNPPTTVEYHGALSQVNDLDYQGPYMEGTYLVESNGNRVSGNWRAQMPARLKARQAPTQVPATAQVASSNPEPAKSYAGKNATQEQPASTIAGGNNEDKNQPPSLSGNWDAAYEYNFGIVHSVMLLNQKSNTVTGQGIDTSTKEKFVIESGSYKFPNLTLVRSYKKKLGAKSDRNIVFKATVSIVKDADYEGPYLSGKTQGGGSWEAQLSTNAKTRLRPDKNAN